MNGRGRSPAVLLLLLGAGSAVTWATASHPPIANGGPPGGHLTSIAIAASRPLTLAVTTFEGSIHRSDDGGQSWREISPPDHQSRSIAIDPDDREVLYAESGDGGLTTRDGGRTWIADRPLPEGRFGPASLLQAFQQRLWTASGRTLLVSDDGGRSWTARDVPLAGEQRIDALAIAPADPSRLYVASAAGLHRSDDGGRTFAALPTFPADLEPTAIACDRQDADVVYVATASGDFYRSTSGGAFWTELGDGLPDVAIRSLVAAGAPWRLYAVTDQGLFVSSNGGAHWHAADTGGRPGVASINHQLGIGPVVVAHPTKPLVAFAATTDGLLVTTDGGDHWTSRQAGPAAIAVGRLLFEPGTPSSVLATAGSRTFATTDGDAWREVPATAVEARAHRAKAAAAGPPLRRPAAGGPLVLPNGSPPVNLTVVPDNPSVGFASAGRFAGLLASGSGVWRTDDAGATWQVAFRRQDEHLSDDYLPLLDPAIAHRVYVLALLAVVGGGQVGELHRSDDFGRSWTEVDLPSPSLLFRILPTRPATLLMHGRDFTHGGFRLWRSRDAGGTWTEVRTGLPTDVELTDIAVDPTDPQRVFAATAGRGVFRSRNAGATWTPTGMRLEP